MNLELIIRPEVEADIAEAFDWYEAQVSGLGSEFLLALDALFDLFGSIPRSLSKIPSVVAGLQGRVQGLPWGSCQ